MSTTKSLTPVVSAQGVTLYHGDCRTIVPRLIQSGLIDPGRVAVVTDPPYVIGTGGGSGIAGASKTYRNPRLIEMASFDFLSHIPGLIEIAGSVAFFHSRAQLLDYALAIRAAGMSYDLHVWHKPSAVPFICNTWKPDLEYIAVGRRKGVRLLDAPVAECSKVWTGSPPGRRQHAAQKPIGVMRRYLRLPGVILDPFAGSGTTLVLAAQAGRTAIGIERDEGYCQLIARRLQTEVPTA